MIDLERAKNRFANHVATFQDLGSIKVLDFKKPGTVEYRIRFVFEADYYRLHISGDLGELTAVNFTNMTWEHFYHDFVGNPYYFEEKVRSHERPLYEYNYDKAFSDLKAHLEEMDCIPNENLYDTVDEFIEEVIEDFSDEHGLDPEGYRKLQRELSDAWEIADSLGKTSTGIIEVYLLAFRLAFEQLINKGLPVKKKGDI